MSDIKKAPSYAVPPAFDARGGDRDWVIGGIWAGILAITALICAGAVFPLIQFKGGTWPGDVYTAWRITPARIICAGLAYALAGAIQLVVLRRWLPLSRRWIAAVVIGHLVGIAIRYQIDRALPHPFIRPFDDAVVMHNDQAIGVGWLLVALAQALLLRRFSRRAWEWLVLTAVAMAPIWLGSENRLDTTRMEILGIIAYLLLGSVALVRVLRSAPDQPADLG